MTSERNLNGRDPLQETWILNVGPLCIKNSIILFGSGDSFSEVVATDERPQGPVEVKLGREGNEAVKVPYVVEVGARQVQAKLTQEQWESLAQQEP